MVREIINKQKFCDIFRYFANEDEKVYINDAEIGKILINEEYPFALIKFLDKLQSLKSFDNLKDFVQYRMHDHDKTRQEPYAPITQG